MYLSLKSYNFKLNLIPFGAGKYNLLVRIITHLKMKENRTENTVHCAAHRISTTL